MEIKARLNEDVSKKFQAVKQDYGFMHSSNVIRLLIMREYDRILKTRPQPL